MSRASGIAVSGSRGSWAQAFDRDYWAGVTSWGGFSVAAARTVLLSATVDF